MTAVARRSYFTFSLAVKEDESNTSERLSSHMKAVRLDSCSIYNLSVNGLTQSSSVTGALDHHTVPCHCCESGGAERPLMCGHQLSINNADTQVSSRGRLHKRDRSSRKDEPASPTIAMK
ncbi:Hypothetical predicted protein [Scomber scombrus]|uniref:Uncharacterized protein n=1 Tax=Scomber scombrus TaxID=13677 RepID=A0AAV1PQ94_SCOSC